MLLGRIARPLWRSGRRNWRALLHADCIARPNQVYAAILCSSSGCRIVCNRVAHAITGRGDVVRADALRNEISAHRIASLLRESQVVLVSADVVGVSLNLYFQVWIRKKDS